MNAFPEANRLVEPFTGSGAVFHNTDYPAYLLAEGNKDLVQLFQQLQLQQESFISYCKSFFKPTNNESERYYELREQFNQCTNPRRRSALFLYLNRHGYNGLCRYNLKGIYNVPFGRYVKPYFPEKEMRFFYQKSTCATFIHSDFQKTILRATPGDLVYCDPPYSPLIQGSNFSAYTHKKFGVQEHKILADLAKDAAGRDITVIISNHDTAFTRALYQGAEFHSFGVKRFISCHTENRLPVTELLAIFR